MRRPIILKYLISYPLKVGSLSWNSLCFDDFISNLSESIYYEGLNKFNKKV